MLRNLIRLVEAAERNCPVATYDIDVNLKNRQTAIDKYHYGPANPAEPGKYWKTAAKQWKIDERLQRQCCVQTVVHLMSATACVTALLVA